MTTILPREAAAGRAVTTELENDLIAAMLVLLMLKRQGGWVLGALM